ncbi:MAG: hypothetical protein ABH871_04345 [Pseudomonadota bacterium]
MELTELMEFVVSVFDDLSIPYFITGSCASISYGEPRLTNDIDIVADIKMSDIASFVERFPMSEYYISEEAVREAIERGQQFNIIHPTSGLKVDVIIRQKSEFDDSRFKRSKMMPISEGKSVTFASPEDVIIKKMDYYRMGGSEKHLRDITGMLKISGKRIDIEYISKWAIEMDLKDIWEAVLKRIKT